MCLLRRVEFVEEIIGKEAVKERMKRDILGFSRAKLSDLKKVVKFIEKYIGKEAVKEKMKQELRSFSSIKIDRLNELRSVMGDNLIKKNLEKYNLTNSTFYSFNKQRLKSK